MTTYLHFDLGSNREAYLEVLEQLPQLSAKPSEPVIAADTPARYALSVPVHLKSELETYVRVLGRRLDEMDVHPCTIELRHTIAHMAPDGTLTTGQPVNGIWTGAHASYIPKHPGVTELQHVVMVPKRGAQPPAQPDGWSLSDRPDAWHFHSRRRVNAPASNGAGKKDIASTFRRDREKIASLYKGVEGVAVSTTLEQVVARWISPFEPTEDNQYHISFRRLIGVSDQRAFDPADVYAELKRNLEHKFLSEDALRSRIIANLDPCRRIALAQGVTPLVMGLGFIPVIAAEGSLKFADHFCTRAVSYAAKPEEGQALIGAFEEIIYLLVKSGRSPIMSPPEQYERVFVWAEPLQPPGGARTKASRQKPAAAERNVLTASEHVLTIAPSRPFQPLDEIARQVLVQRLGAKFDLRDLGIIGVSFRTERDEHGGRIGGCLFALVSAPNLDRAKLMHVALCESFFLHRAPFKLTASPKSSAAPGPKASAKEEDTKLRIQQAREHDQLWNALEAVRREPVGTRLDQIAKRFPADYAVYLKYERELKGLKEDIETTTKLGKLMKQIWSAMTGTSEDYLWQARKMAGLPSRNPKKRKKAAGA